MSDIITTTTDHYEVLICGGGTGGISVAARLRLADHPPSVGIIEPSEKHYYQPLWTLCGAGVFPPEESERDEGDFIPPGADWIKDRVKAFDPDHKAVELESGRRVTYDRLVVAMGIQINWGGIKGLEEALADQTSGVSSNYSFTTCGQTFENFKKTKSGRALFTEPVTGVKCGGAPQKILYLAEDYFRKEGLRDKVEVMFASGKGNHFGCPHYEPELIKLCDERGIVRKYKTNLVEIRKDAKEAVFHDVDSGDESILKYDMLHAVPPMGPLDVLKHSPLGDEKGWVDVDKHTLRHKTYEGVYALGDCSNLPTSKTGAAIRKQVPVLVDSLLADRSGGTSKASYDGYTSCPLVTGYGRLILAEFDYDKQPKESFPFDQRKERYSMYALKAYGLPRMYWHGMLRGRM